jgi:NAD(P)-dependent dehydrogenase (short-subunit alcohol dehydrogenase family)
MSTTQDSTSSNGPLGGPLDGAAALVTGGGSGIGLACASALARDGASVTIAGRTAARLEEGVEQLRAVAAPGATIASAVCDVADEEQVAAAVATATEATGALQLCVAAAGSGTLAPVVAMSAEQWHDIIGVNLTGAFFTLKHAGAAMVRAGGGSFVGISSIAAPLTHRYMSVYCVSKTGLEALIKTAADELGPAGVRVNAVRPGLVPTELAAALDDDPAVRDDYLAQMPLGRVGEVDDVARLVRFLLGPESSWITGEAIGVDGGHHLRRGPDLEHWSRAMFGDDATEGRVAPRP